MVRARVTWIRRMQWGDSWSGMRHRPSDSIWVHFRTLRRRTCYSKAIFRRSNTSVYRCRFATAGLKQAYSPGRMSHVDILAECQVPCGLSGQVKWLARLGFKVRDAYSCVAEAQLGGMLWQTETRTVPRFQLSSHPFWLWSKAS